jgi:hypothetical protein
MAARDFSNAGISPARLARGVSFYDVNDAEKEIWSAFFFGALPAITGTGAVTLADTTSSGAGTSVIVGTGAVTLADLTSAGSGTSGNVSVTPSRVRLGSQVRGLRGRGMSPERRR